MVPETQKQTQIPSRTLVEWWDYFCLVGRLSSGRETGIFCQVQGSSFIFLTHLFQSVMSLLILTHGDVRGVDDRSWINKWCCHVRVNQEHSESRGETHLPVSWFHLPGPSQFLYTSAFLPGLPRHSDLPFCLPPFQLIWRSPIFIPRVHSGDSWSSLILFVFSSPS